MLRIFAPDSKRYNATESTISTLTPTFGIFIRILNIKHNA